MPDAVLATLPLPTNLSEAIQRAKKITKRGGLRRELLFIAKVLRSFDTSELLNAIEALNNVAQADKDQFHELEDWREQLLNYDHALTEFIAKYPSTDVQAIRQQIRLYKSAKKPAQKTKAYRQLFQLIKSALAD